MPCRRRWRIAAFDTFITATFAVSRSMIIERPLSSSIRTMIGRSFVSSHFSFSMPDSGHITMTALKFYHHIILLGKLPLPYSFYIRRSITMITGSPPHDYFCIGSRDEMPSASWHDDYIYESEPLIRNLFKPPFTWSSRWNIHAIYQVYMRGE